MSIIRWILTIVLIVVSLILTVIVLMQEGKSQGLGTIAGAADTYWGEEQRTFRRGTSGKGYCCPLRDFLCAGCSPEYEPVLMEQTE